MYATFPTGVMAWYRSRQSLGSSGAVILWEKFALLRPLTTSTISAAVNPMANPFLRAVMVKEVMPRLRTSA